MTFAVNDGEPLAAATLPRPVARAIEYLDALPDGKLVTAHRMAMDLGVTAGYLAQHSTHPALDAYVARRVLYRGVRQNLYGSETTIRAYLEQHHE